MLTMGRSLSNERPRHPRLIDFELADRQIVLHVFLVHAANAAHLAHSRNMSERALLRLMRRLSGTKNRTACGAMSTTIGSELMFIRCSQLAYRPNEPCGVGAGADTDRARGWRPGDVVAIPSHLVLGWAPSNALSRETVRSDYLQTAG